MPLVPHASHGRRGVFSQDVYPLHQMLGQIHVVVTQEDHVGAGLEQPNKVCPFLNQRLPRLVCRMCLAGDDELHRALGTSQKPQQTLRIVQQQVRSLIGREAARKAQCQRVGIK